MKIKILLSFTLLSLALLVFGESTNKTFKEKLTFSIDYGIVHAGSASMTLEQVNDSTFKYSTLAQSANFFDWFFEVRDTLDTFIDSKTLLPRNFRKIQNEGSYKKKYKADFKKINPFLYKLTSKDTVLTSAKPIFDPLSAFFFVRNQNFAVGDTIKLNYVNNNKLYKMAVIVHAEEEIKVRAGKFSCYKIEPVSAVAGAGLFKAEGKLLIWITKDKRKIPVLIQGKAIVGSISVELTDFEGKIY